MLYRIDQLLASPTVRGKVQPGLKRRPAQAQPLPKEWKRAASATPNGEMPCLNLKNRIVLSASRRRVPGNRLDTETSGKVAEDDGEAGRLWGTPYFFDSGMVIFLCHNSV